MIRFTFRRWSRVDRQFPRGIEPAFLGRLFCPPGGQVSSLALAHRTTAAGILSPCTHRLAAGARRGVLAHAPSCMARTTQAHIVAMPRNCYRSAFERWQSAAVAGAATVGRMGRGERGNG